MFFIFPCSFFGVSCLFVSRPLFLFFDFSWFDIKKSLFFFHNNASCKSPIFGQEGGSNIRFFNHPCLQHVTSYFFFLSFLAQILVGVHQPKQHRKHLFSPTKKRFCLISQCLPLFLLVLLGFLFRILFRIPFLNFLLLNLMFLVSSFSLVFFFFLLFFLVPCPLFFLFSSLCFLFVHVMLALLVPFYVCSDVFFCSCFFSFGESSSSQLTFVFPLIGLVLPLLFSRLPCFSFFSSSSSSSSSSSFFSAAASSSSFSSSSSCFSLLCFAEQTAMVAFYLAALVCVRLFFVFGIVRREWTYDDKNAKVAHYFWALLHSTHFVKKTFSPSCLGFCFGRPAS